VAVAFRLGTLTLLSQFCRVGQLYLTQSPRSGFWWLLDLLCLLLEAFSQLALKRTQTHQGLASSKPNVGIRSEPNSYRY